MNVVDNLMMISIAVSDMPKAKEFYADKLGMEVTIDYRQDDDNWYVTLALPKGGATITISTNHGNQKPGTANLYFATSDIEASHKELSDRGVKVGDIQNDLYGEGSGVKFISLEDPDGSSILLVQE